ncbi:BZ3500_MvSof-1268-A1-R1_Chr1-1g01014 [Microbotryum saponariae]|uniref:BZ3500_MvSof-1268-A1-R1_Chr1-1g01014 protein n=1 Tax=Microbotryum saponariae TaxID=289078 RepID=A0A2X0MDC9_9BASI|nr:BZ3500_MvSof-1268-A1-R1_Chr1-1g01014 [Microbotryum saponariae]SCZ93184.1 BZ3501_MvSof-1269-A2-R1_Chr1-1g00611 [Microbotryum saponariae]
MGFVCGQSRFRVHVHRLERACSVTVHEEVIAEKMRVRKYSLPIGEDARRREVRTTM